MKQRYTIHFTSRAQKDLNKLQKEIQKRILKKLLQLEIDRRSTQFKPLVGDKIAKFRLRVGDYRILLDIFDQEKTILILRIGNRKDIYR